MAPAPVPAAPVELGADTELATAGYFQLRWRAEGAVIVEEDTQPDFASPRVIYRGSDNARVLSGKPDGDWYYRARTVGAAAGSFWPLSARCGLRSAGISGRTGGRSTTMYSPAGASDSRSVRQRQWLPGSPATPPWRRTADRAADGYLGNAGYSLGAVGLFMFAPLAARIRRLMPTGYTSGDFIRLRYGNFAWRVFLVISLFYSLGWLVSMGMAGGILIHALTGIPYHYGMTVILSICVGYTLLGGFRAVIGTDFIQALLILTGVVIIAVSCDQHIGFDDHSPLRYCNGTARASQPADAGIDHVPVQQPAVRCRRDFHSNVWWSRAFSFREGVGFRAYTLAGCCGRQSRSSPVSSRWRRRPCPQRAGRRHGGANGRRRNTGNRGRGAGSHHGILRAVLQPGFAARRHQHPGRGGHLPASPAPTASAARDAQS
jgi:hypothetical protein